ncbi:methionyl-tRNA formyltransferase, partial [Alphaproteobacteria bacterium]|nr:methionyl-tRNA formyltransferase [Alphaproteobacteria bacterium]
VCVYSQPPRPKGRGHIVQLSPVQQYATDQGIPVFNPLNFKDPQTIEEFAAHNLDVAIVAAYGLILPKVALDAPKHGCLNIHASLLPRWRGASPMQRSIWQGDLETGITIMQMDEGLDTGDMLLKQHYPLTQASTASTIHDTLCKIGGELVIEVVEQLARGDELKREQQDDTQTTYAPLLKKKDGLINWNQTAQEIDRQIRALNPWPGTKSGTFKILSAALTNENTDQPTGRILDKKGHIACGDGTVLQITKIQPEGKKPMDFASSLNGGYIKINGTLE